MEYFSTFSSFLNSINYIKNLMKLNSVVLYAYNQVNSFISFIFNFQFLKVTIYIYNNISNNIYIVI